MASSRFRKNKEYSRKRTNVTRSPVVLIITEGTKSEVDYFRRVRNCLKIPRSKVKIISSKRSDPTYVINTAKTKLIEYEYKIQTIFCVFDRDNHKKYDDAIAAINQLNNQSTKNFLEIVPAISVPCFELWYLLHVTDSDKSYGIEGSPCSKLEADLKKHNLFRNYDKAGSRDFFEFIWTNRKKAVNRANRLLNLARDRGENIFSEDPSTRVHFVIEALEKIAR